MADSRVDTARMRWRPDEAYRTGLDLFSDVVAEVGSSGDDAGISAWERPAPCSGWRALDVLGHVGVATEFGTRLLRGETPDWQPSEPPGAAVSGDPAAWWGQHAGQAADALAGLSAADLDVEVDSPQGRRTIGQGLSFPAVDLFVHAWDLARSAGRDVEIPDEAIAFAHQLIDPIPDQTVRSGGVFAAEVDSPADASPTEHFIAWTGRNPRWSPRT